MIGNDRVKFRKDFKHSKESKLKMSESHSGKILSKETKEKLSSVRKKYIQKHRKINGSRIAPHIGKNEKQVLDKIEKEKGIKLERQFQILHYFVDGYDVKNKIVYEVDELHHTNPKVKQKDLIRQSEIESYLKCIFIRIKNYIPKGL